MNNENLSYKNKISKKDLFAIIMLILVISFMHLFGFFGRTTFPQDAAIIFEGGYRISSGQVPFQDFYMPMGPVVYLMQAGFNFLFGNNILSMLLHSLILSLIGSSLFYYFARKEFGIFMSIVFSIFFYVSFNSLAFHPFYNHTTFFFFFLNIFLLLYHLKRDALPIYVFQMSTMLALIDFYTKQDMGIMHVSLLFVYFIFNYGKQWKQAAFHYLIPALVAISGIYFFMSKFTEFEYWFNLGQSPHNARISNLFDPTKILDLISSWEFYFIIVFVFMILFKKIEDKNKIKIMSLFLAVSIATEMTKILTGATRQISAMSVPLLIFLIWILIKEKIQPIRENHNIIVCIILIVILLLSVNPFPTYGLVALNYFDSAVVRIEEGCYKGYPILKDDLTGLNEIREIVEKNEKSFISTTQYSFLYCDYDIDPPKNLPIWFDEGNSFYKQDVPRIIQTILSNEPRVILLQEAHTYEDPNLLNEMIEIFVSNGYKIEKVINQTATLRPITVLVRENLH